MHVKSKWEPPPQAIPHEIHRRLFDFETNMKKLFKKRHGRKNILPHQRRALSWLRRQEDFLIVSCNKNLGLAIIERTAYIKMAYKDHLNNATTYQRIDISQEDNINKNLFITFDSWLKKHRSSLSKEAIKFLHIARQTCSMAINIFYLLLKVHKNPLKSRPVVSSSGTLFHSLGVWLDDQLKDIASSRSSYFKSSEVLQPILTSMELPPGCRLFTADAVSMYTNINTDVCISTISSIIKQEKQFKELPHDAIIDALKIIMNSNYFKFGDTFWLQLSGCAMGTPPAPPYATLYFSPNEDKCQAIFKDNLIFYKRFIDDVFGIWYCQNDYQANFEEFKKKMNEWHDLKWEFEDLSSSANFMDLSISIVDNKLHTTLFEKKMNLHLYISPASAHPPGLIAGIIKGMIHRINALCSDDSDKKQKLRLFFNHLLLRGWKKNVILPFFSQINNRRITQKDNNKVHLHLQYHPNNPPSRTLQHLWQQRLLAPPAHRHLTDFNRGAGPGQIQLNRMVVSYSRPPNLGNLLSYRILPESGPQASSFG